MPKHHQTGYGVSTSCFGTSAPLNVRFIHEHSNVISEICQLTTRANGPDSDCRGIGVSVHRRAAEKEGALILWQSSTAKGPRQDQTVTCS